MLKKVTDDSYQLYINGKWVDGKEGKTFKAYNPANGEFLSTCIDASEEDVDDAVPSSLESLGDLERC